MLAAWSWLDMAQLGLWVPSVHLRVISDAGHGLWSKLSSRAAEDSWVVIGPSGLLQPFSYQEVWFSLFSIHHVQSCLPMYESIAVLKDRYWEVTQCTSCKFGLVLIMNVSTVPLKETQEIHLSIKTNTDKLEIIKMNM